MGLSPQSVLFEELLEVVTRPVAKLNIEWPVERECQDHPKNKQAIAFHQLSPAGASSFKTPVLPTKPLRTSSALVGKAYMAAS